MKQSLSQRGFTIIELLLATSFFSFVMLFVLVGFVQINRAYVRGNTVKQVQNTARTAFETIVRDLRQTSNSNVLIADVSGEHKLCLGDGIRYAWNEFETTGFSTESLQGASQPFTLVRSERNFTDCTGVVLNDQVSSVIPTNIVVQSLNISCTSGGGGSCASGSYNVELVVSTANNSGSLQQQGANATCRVGVGDQYCDVARFQTIVTTRN